MCIIYYTFFYLQNKFILVSINIKMPEHYDDETVVDEPVAAPAPEKKKREGVKMTDKQKADLAKHMSKMEKVV